MVKKSKDTLITKTKKQMDDAFSNPSPELLHLFELVNELDKAFRVSFSILPSSRKISERLYSELSPYSEEDVEGYFKHKFWIDNDLLSAKPVKKRKAYYIPGNSPDPPPFIPKIKRVTNEQIVEEIKRTTKDSPKLHSFLFDDNQDLYPITNKRYKKNTKAEWSEQIEGVIDKYDDIRLFAVNLTQMAAISSFHRNEFGLERFKQMELRQNYYLDMPSSRYYIDKGRFRFELDLFAQHLQAVEAFRVRLCFVCQSVFWAYDLREKYCSRKCSNRFSQKKWYSKPDNKDKFLQKKKSDYQSQKEELEKEKQNKQIAIQLERKKLREEKEKQRKITFYKSKNIEFCPKCICPPKTCECIKLRKIRSKQ